jgi:hypothetical protein
LNKIRAVVIHLRENPLDAVNETGKTLEQNEQGEEVMHLLRLSEVRRTGNPQGTFAIMHSECIISIHAMEYIARTLEEVIRRAVKEFPVVVLTGPRQSGKTTLLRHSFSASHAYVSLEPPDVRASASHDPRGFLALHPPPVIFDEVQYAPDLLPYIKEVVDSRRREKALYLLTGSQNLLLMERVTETLAGRAAMLQLLPLSHREAQNDPGRALFWESETRRGKTPAIPILDLWMSFLRGSYPEVVLDPQRDIALWHSSYVQTYLERDVRGLRQIGDLTLFQSFLRTIAARSGQLLNLTDVARGIGLAVNTAKAWLTVLEATYQVVLLRPYFANLGKRLVKTPKVYFTDTGTLCYLLGLRDGTHAMSGPMAGPIFETAVLSEILKTIRGRGEEPQIYFFRTSTGVEVDFVLETNRKLIPIEVKSSSTPRPEMAAAIATFRKDFPRQAQPGYVVHTGDVLLPLEPGVTAIPFTAL